MAEIEPTGYEHPAYAASLSEFGAPVSLQHSRGWALKRPIAGSPYADLIGPYPLFSCRDWSGLPDDLAELAGKAVSFAMVTDPFARLAHDFLKMHFDVALPFKQHFIAELTRPPEAIISKSHRENVRRALKKVEVSPCADPPDRLKRWVSLYDHLTKRHGISGIRAFSEQAFARQLAVPGLVMFEAREIATSEVVGLDLWYLQGDVAYGHLAAFTGRGYELRASYATKWQALHYFSGKAGHVHLGAAAGLGSEAADGLAHFKRGWSTGTRQSFFCGKIIDPAIYAQLVREARAEGVTFFPAYRRGEF